MTGHTHTPCTSARNSNHPLSGHVGCSCSGPPLSAGLALDSPPERPRPALARGNPGSGMWMTESAQVGRWQIRLWGLLCGDRRVPARRLGDAAFWRLASGVCLAPGFSFLGHVPIHLGGLETWKPRQAEKFKQALRQSSGGSGKASPMSWLTPSSYLGAFPIRHLYSTPGGLDAACPPLAKRRRTLLKPVRPTTTVEPTRVLEARNAFATLNASPPHDVRFPYMEKTVSFFGQEDGKMG